MNKKAEAKVEVGMGATFWYWTDSYPATVISVSETEVRIQEDHAKRVDENGMSESQTYEYSPNADGRIFVFTKRKDGNWHEKGQPMGKGVKVHLGSRRAYHDFSF